MGSKTIKCFFVANGSYKRLVIPPLVRDGIGIEKEIHFLCPPKQAISKMLKKRAPQASKQAVLRVYIFYAAMSRKAFQPPLAATICHTERHYSAFVGVNILDHTSRERRVISHLGAVIMLSVLIVMMRLCLVRS